MLRLFRIVARLPLAWLQVLGAVAGRAAFTLSGGYRRKILGNLTQAGYPVDGPEGRRLQREVARHTGRMIGELPYVWFRPLARVLGEVRCDDHHVFEEAEQAGRGILFLTPHLGAFEITAKYYASRRPVTVLFKPPRQSALRPVLEAARNYPGLSSAPANLSGLRSLLRALRRGEAIGILPDQVPTDGDGAWAPFFGRPAYTMTLPQRLAEQTGAAVVLVVGERLPRAQGWRMHAEMLREVPTPEAVNRAMERLIRRLPEQYLWGYNRYKVPPGAAAA